MHKVQPVAEIDCVESLIHLSQEHVSDSEDDRDLHLERVDEVDFFSGTIPSRVNAEWVDTVRVFHHSVLLLVA